MKIDQKDKIITYERKAILTPQLSEFVKYYMGEANLNAYKAAKMAGYAETTASNANSKLLRKRSVQLEIARITEERKAQFHVKAEHILNRLWEEANFTGSGATHAGRINALVWLGKHLGMFQEKNDKDVDTTINYNIVNYSQGETKADINQKIKEKIEEEKFEVEKHKNDKLPQGVLITEYKH